MKTLGTKLDNSICQEFIDVCNSNGQTVSEKIREMIQDEIEFLNNCKDFDKETIEDFRKIRKNIGRHDEGGWTTEDDGTLRDVNFIWFTDKEKNEIDSGQKVTITNKTELEPKPTLEIL